MDFWAYGMGHFINDMTATCWFNYMLFFLSEVVHTGAGPYAILVGQIADGIATPIAGILSDRTKTRIGKYHINKVKGNHGILEGSFSLFVRFYQVSKTLANIPTIKLCKQPII